MWIKYLFKYFLKHFRRNKSQTTTVPSVSVRVIYKINDICYFPKPIYNFSSLQKSRKKNKTPKRLRVMLERQGLKCVPQTLIVANRGTATISLKRQTENVIKTLLLCREKHTDPQICSEKIKRSTTPHNLKTTPQSNWRSFAGLIGLNHVYGSVSLPRWIGPWKIL